MIDLSNFKKISANQSTTTLKHTDGHTIRIAHSALPESMKKELFEFPMSMSGEEITDPSQQVVEGLPQTEMAPQSLGPYNQQFNEAQPEVITTRGMAGSLGNVPPESTDGIVEKGNIDVYNRPKLATKAGIATVRSMGIEEDGKHILIPTVGPNGEDWSKQEAIAAYRKTRQHLGIFQDQKSSDAYGGKLHLQQEELLKSSMVPEDQGIANSQKNMGDYNEAMAGAVGAAKQEGQDIQRAAQERTRQALAAQKIYDEQMNALNAVRKTTIKDINDNHIKESSYLEDRTVGTKIRHAIGLIVGGMGAGLTHSENPAQKFLEKQIERDVESQKTRLDRNKTLLGAYEKQMGDTKDAYTMTLATQNSLYANRLSIAAAKVMEPKAKATLMQSAMAFQIKSDELVSTLSQKKAYRGMAEQETAPEMKIKMLEKAGDIDSKMLPKFYEQLQTAQNMAKHSDNAISAFIQSAELNTAAKKAGSPLQTKAQLNAIINPILGRMSKEIFGVLSESDKAAMVDVFSNMMDNKGTIEVKLAQMKKMLYEKMNFPLLKSIGIDAGTFGRFPSGSSGANKFNEGAPKQN